MSVMSLMVISMTIRWTLDSAVEWVELAAPMTTLVIPSLQAAITITSAYRSIPITCVALPIKATSMINSEDVGISSVFQSEVRSAATKRATTVRSMAIKVPAQIEAIACQPLAEPTMTASMTVFTSV